MIIKRTFEAAKHPVGSPERSKLNLDGATSEFLPSYKYIVRAPGFAEAVRTKAEAESGPRATDTSTEAGVSGNTGKMTAAALAARGPRMRLVEVRHHGQHVGFVVAREGYWCLRTSVQFSRFQIFHLSRSYTLSYLVGIAKAVRIPA